MELFSIRIQRTFQLVSTSWIRQVIFKILQNSLFVTLHQIVYLFLFQFRCK